MDNYWMGAVSVYSFILSEADADTRTGPQTPFIPAMFTEEEDEEIPLPPRVMWLRAKSIDPTYLSFKHVV